MSDRDPWRVIGALVAAWSKYPDQRVGQLIVNAIRDTPSYPDPFYIENDRLAELLGKL